MLNSLILCVAVATAALLLWPRLAHAPLWRAAMTPLASIIGSGFLVLGPILDHAYGAAAPLVMAGLCAVAWAFGGAIRSNMARLALPDYVPHRLDLALETGASWALAFAYIISVAYYLNLFGAFAVSLTPLDDPYFARLVTSGIFALILVVGWTRGFHALERLEQISVGLKLSIIAGLLFGLAWAFADSAAEGALVWNPATLSGGAALALAFGLLVTVQGFETSRYLGAEYDAPTRIRSMKLAQGLATGIYMAYILCLAYLFPPDVLALDETAIIDLMAIVAPILPILLLVAALSAQFSAAVADTGGSGGLLVELTHSRLSARAGYAVLVAIGLALTWGTSVFEIISHASRAFALYYALQSALAARGAWATARGQSAGYAGLALLGLVVAAFGAPVE